MKKLLLLAMLTLSTLTAGAQAYVGGKLGLQHFNTNNVSTTKSLMGVVLGYEFHRDWSLGLGVNYANNNTEDRRIETQFDFAPYVSYTMARWGMVSFFVDGEFRAEWSNTEVQSNYYPHSTTTSSSSGWGVGLIPGISVNVSRRISLVAYLGFLGYTRTEDDEMMGFNFSTRNLNFGLYFNL